MTEEEIKKKNEKTQKQVNNFLGFLKIITVFGVTCTLFWASWNLFFHSELGLGKECWDWWKFSLPTFGIFAILRGLNPYWYRLLSIADVLIYSVFIGIVLLILLFI